MSVEFLSKISAYRTAPLAAEPARQFSVQSEDASIAVMKRTDGSYYAKSSEGLSRFGLIQGLAENGFAPGSMVQNDKGEWSGTVRKLRPST